MLGHTKSGKLTIGQKNCQADEWAGEHQVNELIGQVICGIIQVCVFKLSLHQKCLKLNKIQ